MRAPTILLVSPAFHGYWKAIEASLNVAGYEVRTHIYDAPGTVADRIRNKLAHELPEKYRPASAAAQATARAIAAFEEYRPDIVLVIKGDLLGDNWWQKLEESGVRYGTWLYDELRRMSYTLEDLPRLGALASYSPQDAEYLRSLGYAACPARGGNTRARLRARLVASPLGYSPNPQIQGHRNSRTPRYRPIRRLRGHGIITGDPEYPP